MVPCGSSTGARAKTMTSSRSSPLHALPVPLFRDHSAARPVLEMKVATKRIGNVEIVVKKKIMVRDARDVMEGLYYQAVVKEIKKAGVVVTYPGACTVTPAAFPGVKKRLTTHRCL